MDWEVRHARREDGEDLLELWHGFTTHLSSFDERYAHTESADDRWLSYFENQLLDSRHGTVVVAEVGDDLVGVLEARVAGNHPIFKLENHGQIYGHYVAEEYRQEGIGSALLGEAADWFAAPPREVDFFRITVVEGDTASEEVYEAEGYSPVEHVYEKRLDS
jgi:ribosomal protein S18 acetylase RimI-like enzyme